MIYHKIKQRVYNTICDNDTNKLASSIFYRLIIFLIVANVVLVVLETFSGFPPVVYGIFKCMESVSIAIFTLEYLCRLWTANYIYPNLPPSVARAKYAFSFMAIVDLLVIMPFLLPFIFSMDLRILRMVRLSRLLRVLKINRYTSALSIVGNVIKRKSSQLISSMFVVIILILMASILMYSIEHEAQPLVFRNALSGMWWAISTLTTVGYGDVVPITALGKFLSAVIALLGIGLVAVPTGIISGGFMENLPKNDPANKQPQEKTYCPYCGKNLKH